MTTQTLADAARGVADPEEFDRWAKDLQEKFLLCRDMGHTWSPFRAALNQDLRVYERILRCRRCGTKRHQTLDLRGGLKGTHYEYPDGYQAPPGSGSFDKDARSFLRLESITRLIDRTH